jgi:integrase
MVGVDDFEINRFVHYLTSVGKIPAARIYKSSLRGFSSWIKTRQKTFDTFTVIDAQQYMTGLKNNSTANIFLGAIRGYMKFRNVTLPTGDPRVLIETQRENQLRGIRYRSKRIRREKVALTVDELRSFLDILNKKPKTPRNELIFSGVILHFYFGGRSVELGKWLRTSGVEHPAEIDWKTNTMQLYTAKTGDYRFLAWHSAITPHLKRWCTALPTFSYPNEWLTTRINCYTIGGVHITAKTGRRTVQTQFRMSGVPDYITDAVMGHVSNSPTGDLYMDYTQLESQIKDAMIRNHYMVKGGIL